MTDLESAAAGWLVMMNMHLLNRSGLAAIAAATAFLSTPALAQDATPVAADPAPIVADTPLPGESATASEATSDTLAPAPTAKATSKTIKSTRTATASRSVTPVKAAVRPAIAATVAATPVASPTPIEAPADPAMVAPLPEPVAAAPVTPVADNGMNDMLPIAGAAGLGLLALAGAGFAMRRRRRDDDVIVEENWVEPEYVAAAPIAAAPIATAPIAAFAGDDRPVVNAPVSTPTAAPTGLSRIEAAKRGPTPDNPSKSLKKRLSRAAFFDQRERAVAAGTAVPVSPMAGLSTRLARVEQPERPTAPAMGMGFNRRFQRA